MEQQREVEEEQEEAKKLAFLQKRIDTAACTTWWQFSTAVSRPDDAAKAESTGPDVSPLVNEMCISGPCWCTAVEGREKQRGEVDLSKYEVVLVNGRGHTPAARFRSFKGDGQEP